MAGKSLRRSCAKAGAYSAGFGPELLARRSPFSSSRQTHRVATSILKRDGIQTLVVTTGFIFSSSPRPIQDYSHGMRVRVLDLGINKESLPIFGYVIAPLLRRVCMRRTGNRRKRFIVDENARTDPSVSKAVGENRSVMSVPIALETLIWIVLFF